MERGATIKRRKIVTFAGLSQPLSLFGWLQYLEGAHQRIVHTHHSTRIIELSTVVGGREYGDKLPPRIEFVSVFHDLMGTANKVEIVSVRREKCERR